jgi:PAS domain S-box-containing protein
MARFDTAPKVPRSRGATRSSGKVLTVREVPAKSEHRSIALIANSPDLVAIADADGTIAYLDGAVEDLLGVKAKTLIGTNLFDLVVPDDLDRAKDSWQRQVTTTEATPSDDYWTHTPSGGWLCLNVLTKNLLDDPDIAGIVVTARDVTERKQAERALRTAIGGSSAVVHGTTAGDLYRKVCQVIVEDGQFQSAFVSIAAPGRPQGARVVVFGEHAAELLDALDDLDEPEASRRPVVMALSTLQLQIVQDVAAAPEDSSLRRLALEYGVRSIIALPLIVGDDSHAALVITSDKPNAFSRDTVAILRDLVDDLAHGIEAIHTRATQLSHKAHFDGSLEATMLAIATTVELRNPYAVGHQRRVSELARAIASEMGLDPPTVAGIAVAGSLHDIGEIAIPGEILSRPGPLNVQEWALIHLHPQAGHDIVDSIEFSEPVAEVILQHHERLDGSGYPRGLHGEAILLGARIMGVADTVEAMHSHRSYRPALGRQAALNEITAHRGSLYDPDVVDACVRVLLFQGFTFSL